MTATSPLQGNPNCIANLNIAGTGGSFEVRESGALLFKVAGNGVARAESAFETVDGRVASIGVGKPLTLEGNLDSDDRFAMVSDGTHVIDFRYVSDRHEIRTGHTLQLNSHLLEVNSEEGENTSGTWVKWLKNGTHRATLSYNDSAVEWDTLQSSRDMRFKVGRQEIDSQSATSTSDHEMWTLKQDGTTLLKIERDPALSTLGDALWIRSKHEGPLVLAADPDTAPQFRKLHLIGDPVEIHPHVLSRGRMLTFSTTGSGAAAVEFGGIDSDASDDLILISTKSLRLRCDNTIGESVALGYGTEKVMEIPVPVTPGGRVVNFMGAGAAQVYIQPASTTDDCEIGIGAGPQTRGKVWAKNQTTGAIRPGVFVLSDDQGNTVWLSAWYDSATTEQQLWLTNTDPGTTKPSGASGEDLVGAV